jgi:hypothetical protein
MLAELVMAYFITNTEPMYLRTAFCPCANVKVALHVRNDFMTHFYVDAEPYVLRDTLSGETGRAGAKLKFGMHIKDVDLEYFHESIHNLDKSFGLPIEMDGVQLHWNLIK